MLFRVGVDAISKFVRGSQITKQHPATSTVINLLVELP
jgi:hypothetical protein